MFSVLGETDVFVITTNSYIRKDGCLVMGAGIARQVRDMLPDVPKQLGKLIQNANAANKVYGILLTEVTVGKSVIGAFQVKRFFKDNADLEIIKESAQQLSTHANKYPDLRFDLNYPGIGMGRLYEKDVEPLIACLPNNVYVWTPPN